mmetsp:Transcript_53961/g.120725  ORF Transcript_53961/g.120725 Transcript_53961/m.120725 type:complete len:259 (-) Transcript_53961:143-919(-)
MRSIAGRALLLALAAAAASTAFSQMKVARSARGGEADVQVGQAKVESMIAESKVPNMGKKSEGQSDALAGIIGAFIGLVVAAFQAIQNLINKKVEEPWSPTKEVGATQPLEFFDPLDLAKDEEKFRKYRTAEIKHGRVAMMAAAGAVVEHYVRLPPFKDVPSGVAALETKPGLLAVGVLFAACGFMELFVWKQDADKEPGNFGDPAGWSLTGLGKGAYGKEMRERELNNGRMAMFSALGIIGAEIATGKDAIQQLTFR